MANNKPVSEQNFTLIPWMDAIVIGLLPPEGAKMGIRPLAPPAKGLVERFRKIEADAGGTPEMEGGQMGARLRILSQVGYVVPVDAAPATNGRGWQRTTAGTEWARRHAPDMFKGDSA
jgi:hypothetical protein